MNIKEALKISPEQKVGFKVAKYTIMTIITIVIVMSAFSLMTQKDNFEFFLGVTILILLMVYYTPKVIRSVTRIIKLVEGEKE